MSERKRMRSNEGFEPDSLLYLSDGAGNDLLANIMGYLTIDEIARIETVCRAMKESAKRCWEHIYMRSSLYTFDPPGYRLSFREAVIRKHLTSTYDAEYGDEILDADETCEQHSQQLHVDAVNRGLFESETLSHRSYNNDRPKSESFIKRYERHLELTSILFFVLGSILYLVCAVHDYEWSQKLLELPEWLRQADDDEVWMRYRLEEQYGYALESRRMGGVRRKMTRQHPWDMFMYFGIKDVNGGYNQDADSTKPRPINRNLQAQTPEELYYDLDWSVLPDDIRDSYTALGYNQTTWDGGIEIEIDTTDWADLTPEQQEAAIYIGYTEMIWCELENTGQVTSGSPTYYPSAMPTRSPVRNSSSPSSSGYPSSPPSDMPTSSPSTTSFPTGSTLPSSLPSNVPSSYPTISFQPSTSGSPTSNPTPLPTMKFWLLGVPYSPPSTKPSQLPSYSPTALNSSSPSVQPSLNPSSEKPSAPSNSPSSFPSFDQSSSPSISESPTSSPLPTQEFKPLAIKSPEKLYEDDWWTDLPPDIQEAFIILGWNETIWDNGIDPPSEDMDWAELTPEMQVAASFIGYTENTWDGDDATLNDTNSTEANSSPIDIDNNHYHNYDWVDLPPDVQNAAMILGYDQFLWDSDGESWSEELFWDELSLEAQEAAAVFGYDEASWNADGDAELEALLVAAGGQYVSNDDDYIFTVGDSGAQVSEYQMLYFSAAFCFLLMGLLDVVRENAPFHILMVLAGLFGVISAVYVEENLHLSNIFDCVSVHLYLLEGVALLMQSMKRDRRGIEKWYKQLVLFADSEFITGAFLDVMLSYFYLFDTTADWNTALAVTWVFSSVLWLHCSLIYVGIFIYDASITFNEKNFDDNNDDSNSGSSI